MYFGQAFSHDVGRSQQVVGVGKKMLFSGKNMFFQTDIKYYITASTPTLIQCCSKDFKCKLSPSAQSSHCISMEVPSNDVYYGNKSIRCLSYGRLEKMRPINCSDTRPLLPVSAPVCAFANK